MHFYDSAFKMNLAMPARQVPYKVEVSITLTNRKMLVTLRGVSGEC